MNNIKLLDSKFRGTILEENAIYFETSEGFFTENCIACSKLVFEINSSVLLSEPKRLKKESFYWNGEFFSYSDSNNCWDGRISKHNIIINNTVDSDEITVLLNKIKDIVKSNKASTSTLSGRSLRIMIGGHKYCGIACTEGNDMFFPQHPSGWITALLAEKCSKKFNFEKLFFHEFVNVLLRTNRHIQSITDLASSIMKNGYKHLISGSKYLSHMAEMCILNVGDMPEHEKFRLIERFAEEIIFETLAENNFDLSNNNNLNLSNELKAAFKSLSKINYPFKACYDKNDYLENDGTVHDLY